MQLPDVSVYDDEQLCELLFILEDRLPKDAAEELARRDSVVPFLTQLMMDKQAWLMELPEWWGVVHATFIMGHRGGEEAVVPLISALRWSDAFSCDWVAEVLPAILGKIGPPVIPQLTAVTRDLTAGWSARDLAMKGLAAISLNYPDSTEHVFRIIGQRLMDEGEDYLVRHLAGQILLDFRRQDYHLPLMKLSRDSFGMAGLEGIWPAAFGPEDVEWAFRKNVPEVWHYQEDWMRFYEPAEIQRRQKRWARERLGFSGVRKSGQTGQPGQLGQLVSLFKEPPTPEPAKDPDPDEQ